MKISSRKKRGVRKRYGRKRMKKKKNDELESEIIEKRRKGNAKQSKCGGVN